MISYVRTYISPSPSGVHSIQAFILSDNCGEILEEELEGEGENKVVVVDERDPEVLSAPHSRQAGLMSPLSVPSGLLSPLNVHSRLLSPQIAHSNLPFPTVPSLGGPSQNKESKCIRTYVHVLRSML